MDINQVDIKKMHHRQGPDTEREAAVRIASKVVGLRRKVLEALANCTQGATGEQLAAIIDEWLYSVKPRLTELSRMGLVEDSGERLVNSRNRREIVWTITNKGMELLNG